MSQKYVQCGGTSETELKRPVPTASRGLVEKYATDVRMQSPCFLREWPGEGPFFVLINVDSNCVDVALKKKSSKKNKKNTYFSLQNVQLSRPKDSSHLFCFLIGERIGQKQTPKPGVTGLFSVSINQICVAASPPHLAVCRLVFVRCQNGVTQTSIEDKCQFCLVRKEVSLSVERILSTAPPLIPSSLRAVKGHLIASSSPLYISKMAGIPIGSREI